MAIQTVRSIDDLHNCLPFLSAWAALLGEGIETGKIYAHKDPLLFTKIKAQSLAQSFYSTKIYE
jgi:hypothetical protein